MPISCVPPLLTCRLRWAILFSKPALSAAISSSLSRERCCRAAFFSSSFWAISSCRNLLHSYLHITGSFKFNTLSFSIQQVSNTSHMRKWPFQHHLYHRVFLTGNWTRYKSWNSFHNKMHLLIILFLISNIPSLNWRLRDEEKRCNGMLIKILSFTWTLFL